MVSQQHCLSKHFQTVPSQNLQIAQMSELKSVVYEHVLQ